MAETIAFIPARYASSRFPGKPLARIHGQPMFWHVYTRTKQCPLIDQVWLATDDARIEQAAQALHVPVIMTSPDHASGTDRVLEAARTLRPAPESIIVNVQGDEPALHPAMLGELLAPFEHAQTQVSTLACPLAAHEAASADRVKVVRAHSGLALYFSRQPIPYGRDTTPQYLGHIGLYAFRYAVLEKFSTLGESPLERLEKLEQLRLLEAHIPIHVALTTHRSHGVDRPEDLATISTFMQGDL
ncbi:MAG: 3-deoxy-manno-octulosonate cytidylyltransferase [Desulfovibrionales bacterium]|nr:3-deoxy-manno-octulosonate cytidylyltransferase [Desulfovibrionales bacterium]